MTRSLCLLLFVVLGPAVSSIRAQGSVGPHLTGATFRDHPGFRALSRPGFNAEHVSFVHLPGDPPHVFYWSFTASIPNSLGGAGFALDILTGRYDALTHAITPNLDAATVNSADTEYYFMVHHAGQYAVFQRSIGFRLWLATRTPQGTWLPTRTITGLSSTDWSNASLVDVDGQAHLLHRTANDDIAIAPVDLAAGAVTGPAVIIVDDPVPADAPSPIVDSTGNLIGVTYTKGDRRMVACDLDSGTPSLEIHSSAGGWCGGYVGGRFFELFDRWDVKSIDGMWCRGGRRRGPGALEVQAYVAPNGSPTDTFFSFLLVSASFRSVPLRVPPALGFLGVDLAALVTLPFPQHNNADGTAVMQLAVPGSLSATRIPAQCVTLRTMTAELVLGNTCTLTVD